MSEKAKGPHQSAHINIGKDRISSNLVDEWFIPTTKNAAETAYIKRTGNEFTPFIGGEDAFKQIQAQLESATDTIDIICWGFDPAMPLIRNGKPDETWPFWYHQGATAAKVAQLKAELQKKQTAAKKLQAEEAKLKAAAAQAPKPTTKAQLKKVRDALKQAAKDIAAIYKALEAFTKTQHIQPEEFDMVQSDKVLGNETLGQLLINKAMGVSNSAEFALKGTTGTKAPVAKPTAATTEAKKNVQVRVLMWYPGLLASLGAQNAPGFLQSKFTQTLQSVLNSEIGKLITKGLGGITLDALMDAQLGRAVDAIMKGKDWVKVSNKISRIFGSASKSVSERIGGKIGSKLGEIITDLGDSASKGIDGVKEQINTILKDQSKLLKDIVLKASSTAIQGLLQELVKGIYPARDYYNQAWFTAAALGKIEGLEFRIRSFDPLLPSQLSSWLFSLDKLFSSSTTIDGITHKKKPERAFFEQLMLEEFKSHHQKSIMVDYMKADKATGFILGFNFKSAYWDSNAHLADNKIARREPGVEEGPYQDIATMIRGSCLFDLNKNFTDAWDQAEPNTQDDWLKEMNSWSQWLENPSKEIKAVFSSTGKQLWELLKEESIEAIKDVYYDTTNKEKQQQREKKQAEKKAPKAIVPGPLAADRAGMTVDKLVKALPKKNNKTNSIAGQVLRTYPDNDPNFSADDGIKLAYHQSIIQRPRVFAYVENQYLQLAEWAKALKTKAQETQSFYQASGVEVNPLSVFVVTCIQERAGMLKRHQEMLKEWDKGGQLTQMQKKEEPNKPAEAKKAADADADIPPAEGVLNGPLNPELAGTNPIAVNLTMLRALERNDKYTDAGFWGQSIEVMLEYMGGKKRVDEFDDDTIKEQQDKFESGKDLDFWQNVIHPSRFYQEIYVHTKLAVIDDQIFTMGSANLSRRSMEYDSELNLLSNDTDTAYNFRDKLFKQHTTPYGAINRRTKAMTDADTHGDDATYKQLELDGEPQEPNFPKVQYGSVEIAEQVTKSHGEWTEIMKYNDKIMMMGKQYSKGGELCTVDDSGEPLTGQLETFLCRLIDQRSAGLITIG